jgi:hypothetical protein
LLSGLFQKRPSPDELKKRGVLREGRYFGVPLARLCAAGVNGVPRIVVECCEFLEARGIEIPGIFRVSGEVNAIQGLKKALDFDEGRVDFAKFDPHAVAGVRKSPRRAQSVSHLRLTGCCVSRLAQSKCSSASCPSRC